MKVQFNLKGDLVQSTEEQPLIRPQKFKHTLVQSAIMNKIQRKGSGPDSPIKFGAINDVLTQTLFNLQVEEQSLEENAYLKLNKVNSTNMK